MSYEGWTDWQTSYVHLMMGNDRKYNDLRHRIVRGALDRTLYNAPGGQRPTSDEAIYQAVAKLFAKYFRSVRDMAKKEFDEELQDTINERGEFEARQIEGKKPEPSEHGRTGDILNEAMDLIRSDMGSGPLPEWREPNWLEMAEWEVEEEKLQRRSAEAAERLTRQPGEEPELPSDMVEGLGRMGIKGSKEQTMKKNLKDAGFNFSPSYIQTQVQQSIPGYDKLHDDVDFPNADFGNENNHAMLTPEISGDMHTVAAIESAFDNMTKVSYVSTSPAGAAIGGVDVKPRVEDNNSELNENMRKPSQMDDFYMQRNPGPVLANADQLLEKLAAFSGDEKQQFSAYLKRVMAEVAATFISVYKVTNKPPLNKVPGTGELQLEQVEQQQYQNISGFNIIDNGSRLKYLVEKMNDSDIQECINDAWAQAAVWCSSPGGGFVYEVFCRAETLDSESLVLKYRFVTGLKDSKA